jgi:uncharacterized membrane protein
MFVVFPLGLFVASLIFDIIYLVGDDLGFARISFWNIAVGLIGAAIAAVLGLVDFLAIPRNTRARRIGVVHGLGNVLVVGLFLVSWLIRFRHPANQVTASAFVLSLLAVALAVVTAWLGGELVDRLGVGVEDGANLDAPSSLAREPKKVGSSMPQPPLL